MKIKDVKQQTGLTDRAIRHYIECGLLTPHTDDSHTRRHNFTFTREDVERLLLIKTLREADFSLDDIALLLKEQPTRPIVQKRLAELKHEQERRKQLVEALQKADLEREVSLEELTVILSTVPTKEVVPTEIYAPTPIPFDLSLLEAPPFTMHSTWWRKVYGETTVPIKDTVHGVIQKMQQQQREGTAVRKEDRPISRPFRCKKDGRFVVRDELDSLGIRGKVYTYKGKTYIRFYELYEPLWTLLLVIVCLVLFPLLAANFLYQLLRGDALEAAFDTMWGVGRISSRVSRRELLSTIREDMLTQIEAIKRWDD